MYFIEYVDGGMDWCVPNGAGAQIEKMEEMRQCREHITMHYKPIVIDHDHPFPAVRVDEPGSPSCEHPPECSSRPHRIIYPFKS